LNTSDIVIPKPALVIPGFADLPEPIQAVIEDLSKPFPVHEVKVRPGSVRRDGSAALCLAYGDWWTCYLPRLNDQIGPNNWQIDLQLWGEHQIIARLRAFGGLIEKASSGSAKGEANGAQEAEVQAKKRVCAEGVMLGLFFYFLPKVWGKGERVGKDFYFSQGEEERCVYEMYARAGLLPRQHGGVSVDRHPASASAPSPERGPNGTSSHQLSVSQAVASASRDTSASPIRRGEQAEPRIQHPFQQPARPAASAAHRPDPQKVATARTALAQAERDAGVGGSRAVNEPLATDPQLGKLALLIHESPATNAMLDRIGAQFGFPALSALNTKVALKQANPALTRRQASALIDTLQRTAPEG
jgi:hypothetical protein